MEWLNYHHLRYFWAVAREGSLARAAARLHVSQPAISEQLRLLEESLGEKLFRREGRRNELTDVGQMVAGYADEIFALGQELTNAVKQRPGVRTLRLQVGVTDSLPKLLTHEILKPVFDLSQSVHVVVREGKLADLLAQLGAHRLDLVLSDEPAGSGAGFRVFNQLLGVSPTIFCAERRLAARLRRNFPASLNGAPALLPADSSSLRNAIETWFREREITPRVVAECDDLALMKVMAAEGRGFIVLPEVAREEAGRHYGFACVGTAQGCETRFYAITAERRIHHPAVTAVTQSAGLTGMARRP